MTDERFLARARRATRRRVVRIALAAAGAVVIASLVWIVWFSQLLSVRSVDVDGQTTLRASQIRATAAVPTGRPLARLDLTQIETRVARMERVQSVDVSRSWPHAVHIEVVERTPLFWMTVGGAIRGVDRFGIDFRTYAKAPAGLLEATVTATEPRQRLQTIESVASVIELIRTKSPSLRERVQSVSAASKDSIELVLSKDRTVVWGSEADGARKLQVLSALLKLGASRYDVSAPDQPTTSE